MSRGRGAPWSAIRSVGRFQRDARVFLVTTFVAGAALSLYWIDFNLYLASLGLPNATIGAVSTIASRPAPPRIGSAGGRSSPPGSWSGSSRWPACC
jgi:hypothetical protein